jgi:hypothetical protein
MTRTRLLLPLLASAAIAASWLHGPTLRADEKPLPSDLVLVPRDAPGFVSVRMGDLADSAAGKEFLQQLRKDKERTGDVLADMQRELIVPPADVERVTFIPGAPIAIVRTAKPYDRDKLLDAMGGEARVKRSKGKTIYVAGDERAVAPVDDSVFVRGPAGELEKLLDAAGAEGKGALDDALQAAAGKHHVTVGINPTAFLLETRRRDEDAVAPPGAQAPAPPAIEKKEPPPCGDLLAGPPEEKPDRERDAQALLRGLPAELLAFKPLLQARCITLTFDLDGARLEGRVDYADKALTADGETALKTALYVLRELLPRAAEQLDLDPEAAKELQPLLRPLQDALKGAVVRTEGATVTASAQAKIDPAVFALLALQVGRRAQSVASSNNLKQIALAMMNFNDAYGAMPGPAIYDQRGNPLLSWRVALLPYIEQGNLYNQFKLDEPWDSPNNKKLLEKMPKVYAPVRGKTKQPYSTYYQVFVGPAAPFQMVPGNGQRFWVGGPRLPASFPDGTSNTFLIVEAGEAVPWTKPDDIAFDEKKPVPPLGGDFGYGFHAAMADGSVLFIRKNIDDKLLKLLIMPADGIPIDWDKVPVLGRGRRSEPGQTVPDKEPLNRVKPPPEGAVPPPPKDKPPAGER